MGGESFVDMCAVCKQGVSKEVMAYQKGRVFHQQCFDRQGGSFPTIDSELAQLSARTRVELVQMKNLKVRTETGQINTVEPKSVKKSIKKISKKIKTKKSKKIKLKVKKVKKSRKSKKQTSKRRR